MSKRNSWAAASGAALVVAVLAGCAADPGTGPTGPQPTPPAESPTSEAAMDDTVQVSGQLTPFSAGDPRTLTLTGTGGTLVAVHFADELVVPLGAATVLVSVPTDFEAGDSDAELFDALSALSSSTGEPLEVVALVAD